MSEILTTRSVGIKIENLSLSFGTTEVLKNINLEIKPGEFFSFLGPSGSGKSTLLRAIAGFGPAPSGRIIIGDEDVTSLPPWKRNVGMVFQSYALWPHMSVWKNVAFGLEERKVPKSEIKERVEAVLKLVGLLEMADRRPSQLSGGQQQRVALARTIVVLPRVLLLDEPLSNLDANLRVQMRRDILKLQRKLKLTTIFVTHDQEEANTISDRMALINDGIVQQIGTPIDLYDNPKNLFVATFLGTANVIKGKVRDKDGKLVFIGENDIEIPMLATIAKGEGNIVIRPQNISIHPAEAACPSNMIRLEGTIKYREFLGSVVRYSVNIGKDSLLVDDTHKPHKPDLTPGTRVQLFILPEQVIFLPD